MTDVLNKAAVYRMPAELLIQVAESFSVPELFTATHVCRLWRSIFLTCPTLWAKLDTVCLGEKALAVIPYLLPRSKALPLDISVDLQGMRVPNDAVALKAFYLALAAHVNRLRRFSWRSKNYTMSTPLFGVLQGAQNIQSLHLALRSRQATERLSPPGDAFVDMPQLSSVHWAGYLLPVTLHSLSHVIDLRISQESLPLSSSLFEMFPRARSIRVDACHNPPALGALPVGHPLDLLELSVKLDYVRPPALSWRGLRERRCTDVPVLILRHYSLSTLFAACQEGVWRAQSLSIHYNDDVDAVLRDETGRECRIICFRSAPRASNNAQRLMYDVACLHSLETLALPLPLSTLQRRQTLLVPQLPLRALRTLVILCAQHKPVRGINHTTRPLGSLLDPDILATCGVLRAPNLTALVLKYHPLRAGWQDPMYNGVVDPAALAEFIGEHILIDGELLPELRIDSPRVRLADDADGMDALTAVVGTIFHGL